MKKFFLILLLIPFSAMGQSVLFDKSVYNISENVTCTLLVGADGIENGIVPSSMRAVALGKLNLGTSTSAGYFPVTFKFGAIVENYCVLILPTGVGAGSGPPIIKPAPASDSRYGLFLDKLIEYSKEKGSFRSILDRVFKKYVAAYPVQGPVTVVACIGVPVSGSNPIFVFTCKQGLEAMAKDLGVFTLESINEELLAKGKISQDDYNFYKINIGAIQYLINAYTADGVLDTFSAIATATDTDTGDHLAYGASISDQVIKKYQFIIKFKPK
ncbi:MAG: hypothetical protein JST50_02475 [Bacteroidetes bacterium]|nr:hypothetical protein [Bacteroidota bacterium]